MGIVKFRSKASAEIVMLKPHAQALFKTMGLEFEERGVITPDQLSEVIARITAAMLQEKMAQEANPLSEDEEAAQPKGMAAPVSLQQRAYPLLKMLQEAAKIEVDVHWGF
jgi:DNA-binding response OmpR family regulator